ncbi:MAG: hypothetical protein IJT19_09115 [Bacteroidaceae bacterium]|nr:hypothetical protein [Bacteroidaceae bacterium]
MVKKYRDIEPETVMAAEPVAAYEARRGNYAPSKSVSTRERVMASTVSVDEYFDELISLVHKDYANL